MPQCAFFVSFFLEFPDFVLPPPGSLVLNARLTYSSSSSPAITPTQPVSSPQSSSVESPVSEPVQAPVQSPLQAPVAAPLQAPIAAPSSSAANEAELSAPVAAPSQLSAPVAAPSQLSAPVSAPSQQSSSSSSGSSVIPPSAPRPHLSTRAPTTWVHNIWSQVRARHLDSSRLTALSQRFDNSPIYMFSIACHSCRPPIP